MALQEDDGSCAPWLCHYCNALSMDCSAFQAHCLLHLRRPKVKGWVPSREYLWETASTTVEKMLSDSITLGLMWHIGKVLQLLFESYWRDIEPVFYESYWRDIGVRTYLRGIWEILGNCHWKVLVNHWNCFLERVCRNMCVLLSLHWFLMKKVFKILFFLNCICKYHVFFTGKQMYLSSLLSSF